MYKYIIAKFNKKGKEIIGVETGASFKEVRQSITESIKYDMLDDVPSDGYRSMVTIVSETDKEVRIKAELIDKKGIHSLQKYYNVEIVVQKN